ncbi:MAG: RagB/SusD family nutrient uptake outer membrane protein [Bacteroidota bacterium]
MSKWIYLLIAVHACSTFGCQDFLTIEPEDELSRQEVFSSIRGADAAVVGLYNLLGEGELYQINLPIFADVIANLEPLNDEQVVSLEDIGGLRLEFIQAHALRITPGYNNSSFDAIYADAYNLLYQANDILAGLELLPEGSSEQRASLRAEALCFRALVHFDLLRLYAQAPGFSPDAGHPGIVLMEAIPSVFAQSARSSVAAGFTSVCADLEEAERLMDSRFTRRSTGAIWLTPTAVQGLLARVAAYRQDWEACLAWANRCLSDNSRALSPSEQYLDQWEAGSLSETIWQLDLQRNVEVSGSTPVLTSPARVMGAGNEDPFMQLSQQLLDQFEEGDLRRQLIVTDAEGNRLSRKWPFAENQIRNVPLLRLSEIFLLRAEAAAELNQLELATADYRLIRLRAEPEAVLPPLMNQEDLRRAIREERRRELALEGHHFFDLGRWGADLERLNCASLVSSCALSYPDPRYVLPIPLDAILRNPNLTQNEGY